MSAWSNYVIAPAGCSSSFRSPCTQGYPRRMLLTWSTGAALLLDSATLKHSYFETSTTYTVMRSMHSLVLPTVNSTNTYTGLIFFGKYDVSLSAWRACKH